IEDEQMAADDLEKVINNIDKDVEVAGKTSSVISSIKWLQQNEVDLILSDIQLGDGLCFEIFESLNIDTPIIITTAYDNYAIQAFKQNSIDYLLKPIDEDDLEKALNKYKNLHGKSEGLYVQDLIRSLKSYNGNAHQERFLITLGERIESIPVSEVAYFFSEDRYTYLVGKSGRQHIINTNLGELEGKLDPKVFFRINRKYIVGYWAISKMVAYSKSRVKIELTPEAPNSMDVVVSVERSGSFKKWLNQ
ncbi:MAG: LytTR family DNA-binding domain-containing protein, partial [Cyclobacteriaceae bacterium]